MATTPTRLMTFAEFEQIPDDPRGWRQELRHGEVITLAPPKHDHYLLQYRLRNLLENASSAGVASTEMGFRPRPDHEFWFADVAWIRRERWDQIPRNGNIEGAPDLVVEVLSPSNTAAEMLDKEQTCLENGAGEFWVVDIDRLQVKVSTPDGHTITYKSGQQIPLFFAPGSHLAVDAIFE